MNGLHTPGKMGGVLLIVAAIAAAFVIAGLERTVRTPACDIPDVSAAATTAQDASHLVRSRCLVYGKYCLGDFLRGR